MPVFTRVSGSVLLVTVDGDYTPAELRRVGEAGILDPGTPKPARVLLDMSGAAGLSKRKPEELKETARFFGALRAHLDRVAILAPDDLSYGLMRLGESWFEDAAGSERAMVFRSRAEALEWLNP